MFISVATLSGFVELDLAYGEYILDLQIHLKHCQGMTVHIEQVLVL